MTTTPTNQRLRWTALAAAASCLALLSCEQGNAGILSVEGNVVPQALLVNNTTVCQYTSAQAFYLEATMDLALSNKLHYTAYVRNNLVASTQINSSAEKELRQDTNTITITGVSVKMTREATVGKEKSPLDSAKLVINGATKPVGPVVDTWTTPAAGFVGPAKYTTISFDLVPYQTAPGAPLGKEWSDRFATLAATSRYKYLERVTLSFRILGTTTGGNAIESGEISYPVTLCWGCLLSIPGVSPSQPDFKPDDAWKVCSTGNVGASFVAPCAYGNYDAVHCGWYCQQCKIQESVGQGKCDSKFCPSLL